MDRPWAGGEVDRERCPVANDEMPHCQIPGEDQVTPLRHNGGPRVDVRGCPMHDLNGTAGSAIDRAQAFGGNAGYAVIHRLQSNQGADGFNNLLRDDREPRADGCITVDFAAHAAACTQRRPAVVVRHVHDATRSEAGVWRESDVPPSLSGRASYDDTKQRLLRCL